MLRYFGNALLTTLLGAQALAGSFAQPSFDFSTLSGSAVGHSRACDQDYVPDAKTESGDSVKMLGAALVYFSPNNGASILGHVGERFAFCRNHQYFDVLYDYYPFREDDWNAFEARYGVPLSSLTDADKQSMTQALFAHVETDLARLYRDAQVDENRTIYEAWLALDGPAMFKMMTANGARYGDQQARLKKHIPLEPYRLLKNNCTTPVKDDLILVHPGALLGSGLHGRTPHAIFKAIQGSAVEKLIVYPSQRQFRLFEKQARGESTRFDWFLPASDVARPLPGSWSLVFTLRDGWLGHLAVRPLAALVNAGAAAAELSYGIATLPLNWLGKIPQLHRLASPRRGLFRAKMGLADFLNSTWEFFSLQIRYPVATPWTEDEKSVIRDLAEESLLLEYLGAKFGAAPAEAGTP